jgi:hypothetical protein
MGQRLDTIERISNINHGSLAERLYEIRELQKLVRKTETKRRKEKSISRIADQRSSVESRNFFGCGPALGAGMSNGIVPSRLPLKV